MNATYDQIRTRLLGHLRFTIIAWSVALPIMYGLLIWLKIAGDLPDETWLLIALFPALWAVLMVGGMWLTVRLTLAGARTRFPAGGGDERHGGPI